MLGCSSELTKTFSYPQGTGQQKHGPGNPLSRPSFVGPAFYYSFHHGAELFSVLATVHICKCKRRWSPWLPGSLRTMKQSIEIMALSELGALAPLQQRGIAAKVLQKLLRGNCIRKSRTCGCTCQLSADRQSSQETSSSLNTYQLQPQQLPSRFR